MHEKNVDATALQEIDSITACKLIKLGILGQSELNTETQRKSLPPFPHNKI